MRSAAILIGLAVLASASPATAQTASPQTSTPATCPSARDGEKPPTNSQYALVDKKNREWTLYLRLLKCGWSADQLEASQYYAQAALAAELCSTWSLKLSLNPKVAADYLNKHRIDPASEGFAWAIERGYLHWNVAISDGFSVNGFCNYASSLFGPNGGIAASLIIPIND